MKTIGALVLCILTIIVIGIFFLCRNQKGKWRRGFWREFFSRDNSVVNTMAVISLVICAPFAGISIIALIYDIFYLGHGLKDPSVKLISIMVSAGAAGLAAASRGGVVARAATPRLPCAHGLPVPARVPLRDGTRRARQPPSNA